MLNLPNSQYFVSHVCNECPNSGLGYKMCCSGTMGRHPVYTIRTKMLRLTATVRLYCPALTTSLVHVFGIWLVNYLENRLSFERSVHHPSHFKLQASRLTIRRLPHRPLTANQWAESATITWLTARSYSYGARPNLTSLQRVDVVAEAARQRAANGLSDMTPLTGRTIFDLRNLARGKSARYEIWSRPTDEYFASMVLDKANVIGI